jgi:hypothetical protein
MSCPGGRTLPGTDVKSWYAKEEDTISTHPVIRSKVIYRLVPHSSPDVLTKEFDHVKGVAKSN